LFLRSDHVQLSHMKNARGFTLVEILVVVVIITILATIGTLTYAGFQSQSRDQKRSANANVIADSLERYYEKNGEYPSIADVTSTDSAKIKTLFSDPSALVMPNAPSNTINSIKSPTETLTPSIITYDAKVQNQSDQAVCNNANGGCDSFTLRWLDESGGRDLIESRNKDRIGVPQPPQNPILTASLIGNSVTGKVTHSDTSRPVCSVGTPEYKILSNTSDFTPDWSTTAWQASDTKTITSPVPSTEYFFYAIVHCALPEGTDVENNNVAKDSFYYSLATMTASWNGTTALGTLTSAVASPLCPNTQTTKYFIQSKVDTTSAVGQWLPASETWTTTNNVPIPNATNPRKISFRGQARCDTQTTVGTPTPVSNIDFVASAPSTPSIQQVTAGPPTAQWSWQPIICPKDTTTIYTSSFGGNYPYYPAAGPVDSPYSLYGVFNNAYTYEFGARASCGSPTAKVLSSARGTAPSITLPIQELSPGAGRFFIDNYDGSSNRIRGATTLHSDSAGYCPTGTNRYITAQFAHNKTGSDNNQWNTYRVGEYWPSGNLLTRTGNILYATAREDSATNGANSNLEFRAEVYCHNPVTGARGPQRLIDRYGILRIYGQNEGGTIKPYKYRVWCNGQSINESYLGAEWLYCEQVDSYSGVPRGAVRARGEGAAWGGGF
jgi:prepilin-type N-terminal cleavage/methylation domain-containing protein